MNDLVHFHLAAPAAAHVGDLLLADGDGMPSLAAHLQAEGWRVRVAAGAADALAQLEAMPADAVLAGQDLPGQRLLAQVRTRWPVTVRLVAARRAQLADALACVERGDADRHVAEPWHPLEIALVLRQALAQRDLERENLRLADLLCDDGGEGAFRRALADAVRHRTARLEWAKLAAEGARDALRTGLDNALAVFSGLLEMHRGHTPGHARRVAQLAVEMGRSLGLTEGELLDLRRAGLLHEAGALLNSRWPQRRAVPALSAAELADMARHPARAECALMAVEPLRAAAAILRSQQEAFDGSGYPDGLAGAAIPLPARILAVAHDYDALRNGWLLGQRLKAAEARAYLAAAAGTRYDPAMVDALLHVLDSPPAPQAGVRVEVADLAPGMQLASDLLGREGVLLLPAGTRLSARQVESVRRYVKLEGFVPEARVLPAAA